MGSVPENQESRWTCCDEIHRTGQQRFVHDSRTAKVDPFDPQIGNAGVARLLFDQMIFFHDE